MSNIEEVNSEIEQFIDKEWNSFKRPLLISRLGVVLSESAKLVLSSSGLGLKRYIEENLGDRVRVVPMKGRGGAAVPSIETRDYTDAEVENLYNNRPDPTADQTSVPLYWGDIWRGFQKELPESTVRYILIGVSGRPEVADVPKGNPMPDNAKIIQRDDLVLSAPDEPRPSRIAVHQAIENWCRRENIPLKSVRFDTSEQSRRLEAAAGPRKRSLNYTSSSTASEFDKFTSLMQGIDLLNRDELARISIPADLVLAILERSGSR